MSYARRIAYNTVIQIIGRVITTAVSLTTVSLLNSGLKAEGWGVYVTLTTFIGFFAVLADMGINVLYLQDLSRYSERHQQITAQFLGFRLVTALFFFALGPIVASFVPVYSHFIVGIAIVSLGQFFLLINQIFVSIFQVHLKMDRAILTDIIGRVAILVGSITVFHMGYANPLQPVLWVVVIGSFINMLASYILARPFVQIGLTFKTSGWPRLLVRMMPMAALSVLGMIHFKADSVILALEKPSVDVGIYGNAYKVMEVLITLPAIFSGSLFPKMNQAIMNKDPDFPKFIQKAFDLLLFTIIPLVVIVIASAPFVMGFLTHYNVIQASSSLRILSLAMIPLFLGSLVANVLVAAERQKEVSVVELIAATANIALNLYLIPRFTYYGAAWATVTTETLTVMLTLYLLSRHLHFLPRPTVLKQVVPIGGVLSLLILGGSTYIQGHYFNSYLNLSRPWEGIIVLVSVGMVTLLYIVPFFLTGTLPMVVQERINGLLKK